MEKELKNQVYDFLKEIISDEKSYELWNPNSKYFDMKLLSIDQRGRVGEYFLKNSFKYLKRKVVYIDNSHGDYDLEVDGFKIEIKTATLDKSNKFQHEGIKDSKKWDFIAFLDIAPDDVFLTFLHKDNFEFGIKKIYDKNVKIYGTVNLNNKKTNIHFRGKDNVNDRATGAGYKVDFKKKDIESNILTSLKTIDELFEKAINSITNKL